MANRKIMYFFCIVILINKANVIFSSKSGASYHNLYSVMHKIFVWATFKENLSQVVLMYSGNYTELMLITIKFISLLVMSPSKIKKNLQVHAWVKFLNRQEHPSYFAFPFVPSIHWTHYNISTFFFMDVLHWTLTANNEEKKCYGTSWVPRFGDLCKYLWGIKAAMNT